MSNDVGSKLSQLKARLLELLVEKKQLHITIKEMTNMDEVTDPDTYIELAGAYKAAYSRSAAIHKELRALEAEIDLEINPKPPVDMSEECKDGKIGFKDKKLERDINESAQFSCVYSFTRPMDMEVDVIIPRICDVFSWILRDVMKS
jgi:hypothetical protein